MYSYGSKKCTLLALQKNEDFKGGALGSTKCLRQTQSSTRKTQLAVVGVFPQSTDRSVAEFAREESPEFALSEAPDGLGGTKTQGAEAWNPWARCAREWTGNWELRHFFESRFQWNLITDIFSEYLWMKEPIEQKPIKLFQCFGGPGFMK